MREETLFTMDSLSRDPLRVKGYRFGVPNATPSCVIVGPMTGNAIDQLWIASHLVRFLRQQELENAGFVKGEILIVPTVNPYAFNMGKAFWPLDNTDIDVMFPGYKEGETTQRIAARLFEHTNNYDYGILLEARKDRSECIPHVKVLQNCEHYVDEARDFGLDFIYLKDVTPQDTVSINYNWDIWNAKSFSLISGKKGTLRKIESAKIIDAILRFLSKKGIIDYTVFEGSRGNIITTDDIAVVKSNSAGLFDSLVLAGDTVIHGQPMARIYHALDGTLLQTIVSPCDGVVTCRYDYPLMFQNAIAYRIAHLKEKNS